MENEEPQGLYQVLFCGGMNNIDACNNLDSLLGHLGEAQCVELSVFQFWLTLLIESTI